MVKLVCFLKRKDGMTREEFLDHWHNRHGPLIAGTHEIARHVVRYEQLRPSEALPFMVPEGFDGITIMWFESPSEFEAFVSEPLYSELIAPDEKKFLDMEALVGMMTDEPVVVIGGPA